jgi:hypothetical protein
MFANRFSTSRRAACAFGLAIAGFAMTAAVPAQAGQEPLFAVLHGNYECNGVAPPAGPICMKGDLASFGSATIVIVSTTRICFSILVSGLGSGATLAHIHQGRPGVNGPIKVTLVAPVAPNNSNPGASSGCVNVPAATLAPIVNNPTEFYVNVHSVQFGGGALRGQLF